MSSMFKKKGGPAFKPKIPSARARPAPTPTATLSQPARPLQNQASIDSQSPPAPQDTKNTAPEAAITEEPKVSRSQESIEPPRQNSPAETPPEASETAKADNIPSTEKLPKDKPQTHKLTSEKNKSEQATIVDGSVSSAESAHAVAAEAQPSTFGGVIVPTGSENGSSGDSQTDITLTTDSRPDAAATQSSATPEEVSEDSPQPPLNHQAKPAPRPRTRRQVTTSSQDGTGEVEEDARPKKRQRKTTQQDTEGAPQQPKKRRTPNGESKPRRRARSITPEDSEAQVVDLQQLKMSDLTRDLHIGKKFSRHDELRERERKARLKSRLGDSSRDSSATPEPGAKSDSPSALAVTKSDIASPGTPTGPGAAPPASGPQFRIVDGEIVIDQSSLAVDRHARAAAALGDMETVEENDFTRLITSNSFMNTSKLKGPNIWTDSETELFYRGLRMFGTDFEIISKMFPGKQRRHVKLKFNREERHSPRRVNAALIGEKTVRMDIEEYKAFTGATFESVESIEAEHRKRQEDFEAEQKRIADEQAEIMRKKREELFADDDEDLAKKKKGIKKGKQKVIYGLNGEPIGAES
ncbi:hypothetical protein BGZ63DRAFT_374356 [Mariannaea sp. PMI_226]|nr:hypothetical protein BGZ63DRAFT_374356 [Mariannaea sp. PMI_226]